MAFSCLIGIFLFSVWITAHAFQLSSHSSTVGSEGTCHTTMPRALRHSSVARALDQGLSIIKTKPSLQPHLVSLTPFFTEMSSYLPHAHNSSLN